MAPGSSQIAVPYNPAILTPRTLRRLHCAGALLGIASAALGQQPEPRFDETVVVRVVNVEVTVTAGGKPVTDLGPGDFELLVDGRPVEITNFFRASPEPAAEAPAAVDRPPAPVPSPPPATIATPAPAVRQSEPTAWVFYVDNVFLRGPGRKRVFSQLVRFVRRHVREGERVLVASYDPGLEIRLPWTADPRAIDAALDALAATPTQGAQSQVRLSRTREEMRQGTCDERLGRILQFATELSAEVQSSLGALERFVAGLSGVAGRKAILFVSDGLPLRSGEELFETLAEQCERDASYILAAANDFTNLAALERVSARANAAGVTLFPLEAIGLPAPSASDVERGPIPVSAIDPETGRVVPASNSEIGSDRRRALLVDQLESSNLESTLQLLARDTGGTAVLNANNVGPELDRIADAFGAYYSLGFRPPETPDGQRHRLKVRVAREGVVVRHRTGWVDLMPEQRVLDRFEAARLWGAAENPLGLRVERVGALDGPRGARSLRLRVLAPIARLGLLPAGEDLEGRLAILLAARGARGDGSGVRVVDLPVRVPRPASEPDPRWLRHEIEVDVDRGARSVAIGLVDQRDGGLSVVVLDLSAP